MSIGEMKFSCYLESKVAFGSEPSVAQKLRIKQTLYTKETTETGEDLVKQDLNGKSVSDRNPGFYMSDSKEGFELKIEKIFYNGKIYPQKGKRRLKEHKSVCSIR